MINYSEADLFLIEKYKDFLPKKIFDAHTHMTYMPSLPNVTFDWQEKYTPEDYVRDMGPILPGVEEIRLNMMPYPADRALGDLRNGLRDMGNDYVFSLYQQENGHVVCPLVHPDDGEDFIWELAGRPGCRGFKCYAHLSNVEDLETASIDQYLPEAAWVVANEKKLPIILHLYRHAALSDPDNLQYIHTMAKRYPNAQLVLAHCARGFVSWTLMESIHKLEDAGNIWFDLSAICESGTMAACILKNAGKRVLWGSDYNCNLLKGRAVSVGMGQWWLNGDAYGGPERATVAAENLMAFYQTALLLNLDQTQIEDIFYNNASQLFG